MKKKPAINKYAYDIDTVEAGQLIAVPCSHENCKRFLVMTVVYPSTMQCVHKKHGTYDMRNQSWSCHQHRN